MRLTILALSCITLAFIAHRYGAAMLVFVGFGAWITLQTVYAAVVAHRRNKR